MWVQYFQWRAGHIFFYSYFSFHSRRSIKNYSLQIKSLLFVHTHTDYDPHVVEQKEQSQPACLPLSYVLRFITDAARKEGPFINNAPAASDLKRKLAIKHHSYSMSSSNRSTTPTGLWENFKHLNKHRKWIYLLFFIDLLLLIHR